MHYPDDTGHSIHLEKYPQRIISLCPSITETLFDLGIDNEIQGITDYCIHPGEKVKGKTRIGGPRTIDHNMIKSLNPDLIIASREENPRNSVMELRKQYPVFTFDVRSVPDAVRMIKRIGVLTGRQARANKYTRKIDGLLQAGRNEKGLEALYLIWKDPWMAAGHQTFINDMLEMNGFRNSLPGDKTGYPILSEDEQIITKTILLSSEPYPFEPKHLDDAEKRFGPVKFCFVDGEMFSWYGTRMIKAIPYIRQLASHIKAGHG